MTHHRLTLSSIALATCCALPAHAAIVEHADVNGIRTFQDTSTGLVWADLDNFAAANQGQGLAAAITDPSYAGYLAVLQAAGFTFAPTAMVNALTATIPVSTWAEIGQLMSVAQSDWGSIIENFRGFSDAGNGVWHSHWLTGPNTWNNSPMGANPSNIFSAIGLWAYTTGVPSNNVPEPGGLALVGLALAAGSLTRRRTAASKLRSSACNVNSAS